MTRTTDITSFTEHRQNLRQHLNRLKSTGRPLYVTTNGETEAVVLSAKAYDELADRADLAEIVAMARRSEKDIKAGRVLSSRESRKIIAKKHGLTGER